MIRKFKEEDTTRVMALWTKGKQKNQNIPGKCQKHIEKMPDMGIEA